MFDADETIRAHLDWTRAFRTAIVLGHGVDVDEIARADRCDLGRWLMGPEARAHAGDEAFSRLVETHEAFHAEAARIAALINEGKSEEAAKALWAGTRYAHASQAVCAAIRNLARSRNGGAG